MLFLYRPRQTWMPYQIPRGSADQAAYNRRLQEQFEATRRVPPAPAASSASRTDTVGALRDLAELHASGALDDAEFAAAKAKVLNDGVASS